jgi:hypothetical protein
MLLGQWRRYVNVVRKALVSVARRSYGGDGYGLLFVLRCEWLDLSPLTFLACAKRRAGDRFRACLETTKTERMGSNRA